jgi:hypothetical protein
MATYTNKRPTFKQVFDEALHLSSRDQRRLRDELTKLANVKLARPTNNVAAIQNGRLLADEVRKELQATAAQSLDDTMRQLRGRSWS